MEPGRRRRKDARGKDFEESFPVFLGIYGGGAAGTAPESCLTILGTDNEVSEKKNRQVRVRKGSRTGEKSAGTEGPETVRTGPPEKRGMQ